MRSLALAMIAVAFSLGGPTSAAPLAPPKAGDPAPDFTLKDQNGKPVTLSAARGQKVVLVFYRGYW